MGTSTLKKQNKVHPFERIQEWSVINHGTPLYIDVPEEQFKKLVFQTDLVSLDVEDDEQGGFVGLGLYDGKNCFYWSQLPMWLDGYINAR